MLELGGTYELQQHLLHNIPVDDMEDRTAPTLDKAVAKLISNLEFFIPEVQFAAVATLYYAMANAADVNHAGTMEMIHHILYGRNFIPGVKAANDYIYQHWRECKVESDRRKITGKLTTMLAGRTNQL